MFSFFSVALNVLKISVDAFLQAPTLREEGAGEGSPPDEREPCTPGQAALVEKSCPGHQGRLAKGLQASDMAPGTFCLSARPQGGL